MAKLTLTQVARLLKSEWFLLILGISSITLLALAVFSVSQRKLAPEVPPGVPWQNQIFAGITTREELEEALGPPADTRSEDGRIVSLYPSTNQYRPHQVEFSQETVELIKEQVIGTERGTLNDYIQRYGQPEKILYGQHGTFAPGHLWGQQGLLVFAGQFDGPIVEIWYFAPTTFENFLQQHPELSTEEPRQF